MLLKLILWVTQGTLYLLTILAMILLLPVIILALIMALIILGVCWLYDYPSRKRIAKMYREYK
jgi:hypothetical protein